MNRLERAIRAALVDDKLPCAQATRLGIRISRCKIGLFGYADRGQKSIVQPATSVDGELEEAVRTLLTDDKLSCVRAWEIAEEHALSKLEIASVVEGLGFRVSACQLGCFT